MPCAHITHESCKCRTFFPTIEPTMLPTLAPTAETGIPTVFPTMTPSISPTLSPSLSPTVRGMDAKVTPVTNHCKSLIRSLFSCGRFHRLCLPLSVHRSHREYYPACFDYVTPGARSSSLWFFFVPYLVHYHHPFHRLIRLPMCQPNPVKDDKTYAAVICEVMRKPHLLRLHACQKWLI